MPGDAPVQYIEAITRRYATLGYRPYAWYEAQSPPAFQTLAKPLRESRLGILCTAGAYVAGQVAFHYKDDTSLRTIARDTPAERLRFAHVTENYLPDARRDPACMLPVAALREAQADGEIGEIAPELTSCMGGIYSQRRVREELIPRVAAHFESQQVDLALLVPL